MKYLLDTATFLWLTIEPEKLSKKAYALCMDTNIHLYLSSVSGWEIAQKYSKKKMKLAAEPSVFIPAMRMENNIYALPLQEKETLRMESLPPHHYDPADRLLICQSLEYDMPILTNDKLIQKYDVETVW